MMLIHKGVRPTNELEEISFKKKYYAEHFDDGSWRLWTMKLLKSGCGLGVLEVKDLGGLIYCPHCEEWFSKEQYEESE